MSKLSGRNEYILKFVFQFKCFSYNIRMYRMKCIKQINNKKIFLRSLVDHNLKIMRILYTYRSLVEMKINRRMTTADRGKCY